MRTVWTVARAFLFLFLSVACDGSVKICKVALISANLLGDELLISRVGADEDRGTMQITQSYIEEEKALQALLVFAWNRASNTPGSNVVCVAVVKRKLAIDMTLGLVIVDASHNTFVECERETATWDRASSDPKKEESASQKRKAQQWLRNFGTLACLYDADQHPRDLKLRDPGQS